MTRWPNTWLVAPHATGRRRDAVPTGEHGVDQGQQLPAGPVRASPLAKVDQRIGGLLDPQPLGQGGP
jgi:hypothetical protein